MKKKSCSYAWRRSHGLLKHRRDLTKWKRVVRCEPTAFELRGVCSCPSCGQPMSKSMIGGDMDAAEL